MDVQYFHQPYDKEWLKRFTVALDVPNLEQFGSLTITSVNSYINLNIGLTLCHPDDHYNHVKGRTYSSSKIKAEEFKLINICYEKDDRAIITLYSLNLELEITLEYKNTRKRIWFTNAFRR